MPNESGRSKKEMIYRPEIKPETKDDMVELGEDDLEIIRENQEQKLEPKKINLEAQVAINKLREEVARNDAKTAVPKRPAMPILSPEQDLADLQKHVVENDARVAKRKKREQTWWGKGLNWIEDKLN